MPPAGKGPSPFAIPLLLALRVFDGVVFVGFGEIFGPLRGGVGLKAGFPDATTKRSLTEQERNSNLALTSAMPHRGRMSEDFVAMSLLSIPCAILGALIGFALNKWAASWKQFKRFLWSTSASVFPVFAIACLAFASTGNAEFSFSYMMKDDFLVPFGIQIAIVLLLTVPVTWLISKRGNGSNSVANVFE